MNVTSYGAMRVAISGDRPINASKSPSKTAADARPIMVPSIYSGQFYLRPYERANGHYTVTFLRYLQRLYPDQQLVIFWDGATYHRYGERIDFLQQVNQGLAKHQWKVTCILLAPHAPQGNPVEDVWLKAKTFVPQHFHVATSFKKVKQLFVRAIESEPYFDFPKLDQYMISCT
jgi:transposase